MLNITPKKYSALLNSVLPSHCPRASFPGAFQKCMFSFEVEEAVDANCDCPADHVMENWMKSTMSWKLGGQNLMNVRGGVVQHYLGLSRQSSLNVVVLTLLVGYSNQEECRETIMNTPLQERVIPADFKKK